MDPEQIMLDNNDFEDGSDYGDYDFMQDQNALSMNAPLDAILDPSTTPISCQSSPIEDSLAIGTNLDEAVVRVTEATAGATRTASSSSSVTSSSVHLKPHQKLTIKTVVLGATGSSVNSGGHHGGASGSSSSSSSPSSSSPSSISSPPVPASGLRFGLGGGKPSAAALRRGPGRPKKDFIPLLKMSSSANGAGSSVAGSAATFGPATAISSGSLGISGTTTIIKLTQGGGSDRGGITAGSSSPSSEANKAVKRYKHTNVVRGGIPKRKVELAAVAIMQETATTGGGGSSSSSGSPGAAGATVLPLSSPTTTTSGSSAGFASALLASPNDEAPLTGASSTANSSVASTPTGELEATDPAQLMPAPDELPFFPEKYTGKPCILCNLGERSQLGQGEMLRIEITIPADQLASALTQEDKTHSLAGDRSPRTMASLAPPFLANSKRQKGSNKCKNPIATAEYTDELEKIGHLEVNDASFINDGGYFYIHRSCALWSYGVGRDPLSGTLSNLEVVVAQSLSRRCHFCAHFGATLSCKMSCPKWYHFPCVAASGGFQVIQTYNIFCKEHLGQVPLVCAEDINCRQCSALGDVGNLIMCSICGDHYHGTCVGLAQLPGVRTGWQCNSCKKCQICRVPDSFEGRTVACELCDKIYHASCLRPMMTSIPKLGWKCRCCRVCSDCGARTPGAGASSRWHSHYTVCDSCYQQRNKGFSCPICHRAYRAAAYREMVKCSACFKFVHSTCDPDAELSVYNARKESNPDYEYLCSPCKTVIHNGRLAAALRRSTSVDDDSASMALSQDSLATEDAMEVDGVEGRDSSTGRERFDRAAAPLQDVGLGKGKPYVASKIAKKRLGLALAGVGGAGILGGNRPKGIGKGFQKKSRFADMTRKRGSKAKMRGIFGVPGLGLQRPTVDLSASAKATEDEPGGENRLVLCSAKDKFVLTQDICVMCGAIGTDQEGCLIACTQCGQCYHPYCTNVKVTKLILQKGWRCLDCTICEGCGQRNDEARLILCDDCDISFHIYCMDPPLEHVPHGTWKCKWCAMCQKCGTNSPGFNSGWMNSYTECGPCASQANCTSCNEGYGEGDLIIQCHQCERWLHCACDQIKNETEAERCAEEGYNCVVCRPADQPPPHLVPKRKSLTSLGASSAAALGSLTAQKGAAKLEEKVVPLALEGNHYVDGVCLSEHGLHQIKALQAEFGKRGKRKPKLPVEPPVAAEKDAGILAAIESVVSGNSHDNSFEDMRLEPLDPKEEAEIYKDGMPWNDPTPPEGFALFTTEGGTVVLRKKRQRNLQKLGIGGFFVRNRAIRTKDGKDDEDGLGEGLDDGAEVGAVTKPKKKPIRRKPKNKLIEIYPNILQDAFFGRALLCANVMPQFETPVSDDELKSELSDDKTVKLTAEELKLFEAVKEKEEESEQPKEQATGNGQQPAQPGAAEATQVAKVAAAAVLPPKVGPKAPATAAVGVPQPAEEGPSSAGNSAMSSNTPSPAIMGIRNGSTTAPAASDGGQAGVTKMEEDDNSDTEALKDALGLPNDLMEEDFVSQIMNADDELTKTSGAAFDELTGDAELSDTLGKSSKDELVDILSPHFDLTNLGQMDSKAVEEIFKTVLTTDESQESQESMMAGSMTPYTSNTSTPSHTVDVSKKAVNTRYITANAQHMVVQQQQQPQPQLQQPQIHPSQLQQQVRVQQQAQPMPEQRPQTTMMPQNLQTVPNQGPLQQAPGGLGMQPNSMAPMVVNSMSPHIPQPLVGQMMQQPQQQQHQQGPGQTGTIGGLMQTTVMAGQTGLIAGVSSPQQTMAGAFPLMPSQQQQQQQQQQLPLAIGSVVDLNQQQQQQHMNRGYYSNDMHSHSSPLMSGYTDLNQCQSPVGATAQPQQVQPPVGQWQNANVQLVGGPPDITQGAGAIQRPGGGVVGGEMITLDETNVKSAQKLSEKMRKDEMLGDMATISSVLYCNMRHPELKGEYPNWNERWKQISKRWRLLSNEEKQPFLQQARDNRSASKMKKTQQVPQLSPKDGNSNSSGTMNIVGPSSASSPSCSSSSNISGSLTTETGSILIGSDQTVAGGLVQHHLGVQQQQPQGGTQGQPMQQQQQQQQQQHQTQQHHQLHQQQQHGHQQLLHSSNATLQPQLLEVLGNSMDDGNNSLDELGAVASNTTNHVFSAIRDSNTTPSSSNDTNTNASVDSVTGDGSKPQTATLSTTNTHNNNHKETLKNHTTLLITTGSGGGNQTSNRHISTGDAGNPCVLNPLLSLSDNATSNLIVRPPSVNVTEQSEGSAEPSLASPAASTGSTTIGPGGTKANLLVAANIANTFINLSSLTALGPATSAGASPQQQQPQQQPQQPPPQLPQTATQRQAFPVQGLVPQTEHNSGGNINVVVNHQPLPTPTHVMKTLAIGNSRTNIFVPNVIATGMASPHFTVHHHHHQFGGLRSGPAPNVTVNRNGNFNTNSSAVLRPGYAHIRPTFLQQGFNIISNGGGNVGAGVGGAGGAIQSPILAASLQTINKIAAQQQQAQQAAAVAAAAKQVRSVPNVSKIINVGPDGSQKILLTTATTGALLAQGHQSPQRPRTPGSTTMPMTMHVSDQQQIRVLTPCDFGAPAGNGIGTAPSAATDGFNHVPAIPNSPRDGYSAASSGATVTDSAAAVASTNFLGLTNSDLLFDHAAAAPSLSSDRVTATIIVATTTTTTTNPTTIIATNTITNTTNTTPCLLGATSTVTTIVSSSTNTTTTTITSTTTASSNASTQSAPTTTTTNTTTTTTTTSTTTTTTTSTAPEMDQDKINAQQKSMREAEQERQWKQLQQQRAREQQSQQHLLLPEQRMQDPTMQLQVTTDGGPGIGPLASPSPNSRGPFVSPVNKNRLPAGAVGPMGMNAPSSPVAGNFQHPGMPSARGLPVQMQPQQPQRQLQPTPGAGRLPMSPFSPQSQQPQSPHDILPESPASQHSGMDPFVRPPSEGLSDGYAVHHSPQTPRSMGHQSPVAAANRSPAYSGPQLNATNSNVPTGIRVNPMESGYAGAPGTPRPQFASSSTSRPLVYARPGDLFGSMPNSPFTSPRSDGFAQSPQEGNRQLRDLLQRQQLPTPNNNAVSGGTSVGLMQTVSHQSPQQQVQSPGGFIDDAQQQQQQQQQMQQQQLLQQQQLHQQQQTQMQQQQPSSQMQPQQTVLMQPPPAGGQPPASPMPMSPTDMGTFRQPLPPNMMARPRMPGSMNRPAGANSVLVGTGNQQQILVRQQIVRAAGGGTTNQMVITQQGLMAQQQSAQVLRQRMQLGAAGSTGTTVPDGAQFMTATGQLVHGQQQMINPQQQQQQPQQQQLLTSSQTDQQNIALLAQRLAGEGEAHVPSANLVRGPQNSQQQQQQQATAAASGGSGHPEGPSEIPDSVSAELEKLEQEDNTGMGEVEGVGDLLGELGDDDAELLNSLTAEMGDHFNILEYADPELDSTDGEKSNLLDTLDSLDDEAKESDAKSKLKHHPEPGGDRHAGGGDGGAAVEQSAAMQPGNFAPVPNQLMQQPHQQSQQLSQLQQQFGQPQLINAPAQQQQLQVKTSVRPGMMNQPAMQMHPQMQQQQQQVQQQGILMGTGPMGVGPRMMIKDGAAVGVVTTNMKAGFINQQRMQQLKQLGTGGPMVQNVIPGQPQARALQQMGGNRIIQTVTNLPNQQQQQSQQQQPQLPNQSQLALQHQQQAQLPQPQQQQQQQQPNVPVTVGGQPPPPPYPEPPPPYPGNQTNAGGGPLTNNPNQHQPFAQYYNNYCPPGATPSSRRSLLLKEQRLLLEDMVEQEKREQANQMQQVNDLPPPGQGILNDQDYERLVSNQQQQLQGGMVRGPQQPGMMINQGQQPQQQQTLGPSQLQIQAPNGGQFMMQQQRMVTASQWRPQTPVQTTNVGGMAMMGNQQQQQQQQTLVTTATGSAMMMSQMQKNTQASQGGMPSVPQVSGGLPTIGLVPGNTPTLAGGDAGTSKSIPLFQANLQPQPTQPPEKIVTDQDRLVQINYENWLQQQNTVLSNQLKYYETEILKLRKVKKQLNTKQRHQRKQSKELTEDDAKELQRTTADHTVIQKQLENARRQQRQHTVILQEYNAKHQQSAKSATAGVSTSVGGPAIGSSPLSQSLIAPQSPLMAPSPSSSQPGGGAFNHHQPPVQSPLGNALMQPNQSPLHSPSPLLSHSPGPASVNSVMQSPGGNHTNSNSAMSPYSTMQPSPRIGTPHSQIDDNPFSPGPGGGPSPSPSLPGRLTSPAPRMTSPQHRMGGQQLVSGGGRMIASPGHQYTQQGLMMQGSMVQLNAQQQQQQQQQARFVRPQIIPNDPNVRMRVANSIQLQQHQQQQQQQQQQMQQQQMQHQQMMASNIRMQPGGGNGNGGYNSPLGSPQPIMSPGGGGNAVGQQQMMVNQQQQQQPMQQQGMGMQFMQQQQRLQQMQQQQRQQMMQSPQHQATGGGQMLQQHQSPQHPAAGGQMLQQHQSPQHSTGGGGVQMMQQQQSNQQQMQMMQQQQQMQQMHQMQQQMNFAKQSPVHQQPPSPLLSHGGGNTPTSSPMPQSPMLYYGQQQQQQPQQQQQQMMRQQSLPDAGNNYIISSPGGGGGGMNHPSNPIPFAGTVRYVKLGLRGGAPMWGNARGNKRANPVPAQFQQQQQQLLQKQLQLQKQQQAAQSAASTSGGTAAVPPEGRKTTTFIQHNRNRITIVQKPAGGAAAAALLKQANVAQPATAVSSSVEEIVVIDSSPDEKQQRLLDYDDDNDKALVSAEVSLNSVAQHGADGDETIIESLSSTPGGYEIVGSPLDSQIVSGEYNLFSEDVVECVDNDGDGGVVTATKKDNRTVTVELLKDVTDGGSLKEKPLLVGSEIEIVDSIDDSSIASTTEDFEAMIDSRPASEGGGSSSSTGSVVLLDGQGPTPKASSDTTIVLRKESDKTTATAVVTATASPTAKEITLVTVQQQQQQSPKTLTYPTARIAIQQSLMQNRPIVAAAHQRLVKDGTETSTAKLSIGNTTISVPILKSFPLTTAATSPKTTAEQQHHHASIKTGVTIATAAGAGTHSKKIITSSGLSISSMAKSAGTGGGASSGAGGGGGGTVISVAGQKINTTSIVTLSSLNLNQSAAPFITKTFARPSGGAVTIQQQQQQQQKQMAQQIAGSHIKIQQQQGGAQLTIGGGGGGVSGNGATIAVAAPHHAGPEGTGSIVVKAAKSKATSGSPNLNYAKLSSLTVSQDVSLPTKIFHEDDSISPDSSISQEEDTVDQLPSADPNRNDSVDEPSKPTVVVVTNSSSSNSSDGGLSNDSLQDGSSTTTISLKSKQGIIPVHVIAKSRENSRSPTMTTGSGGSSGSGSASTVQRIVPQLSPLSQPNELTQNAMNVSQQVRSIMSSINSSAPVSSSTSSTIVSSTVVPVSSMSATTVPGSNISTITFDTAMGLPTKGDNMSKTETIASILKTVSGKTILPAAAIASNSSGGGPAKAFSEAGGALTTTTTIASIPSGTKLQLSRLPGGQTITGGNSNILVVKQVRASNKGTGHGSQKQLVVLTPQSQPGAGGTQQIKIQTQQQQQPQLASGNSSVIIQSQPVGGGFVKISTNPSTLGSESGLGKPTSITIESSPSSGVSGSQSQQQQPQQIICTNQATGQTRIVNLGTVVATSGDGGPSSGAGSVLGKSIIMSTGRQATIIATTSAATVSSVSPSVVPTTSILSATLSQPLLKAGTSVSAISTLLQNQLANASSFRRSKSTDEPPVHHVHGRESASSQILSKRLSLEATIKGEPIDSASDDTNVSSSSPALGGKPELAPGSGCKFSTMLPSGLGTGGGGGGGGAGSKAEDSQNVLLKQLLQNTGTNSVPSPAPSPIGRAVPGLITNQRAPSLGVVSSLEAQLARPIIPPSANPPAIQIISTQSIVAAAASAAAITTASSAAPPSSTSTPSSSCSSMVTATTASSQQSMAGSAPPSSSVVSSASEAPNANQSAPPGGNDSSKPKLISRETSFVSKPPTTTTGILSGHPTPNLAANMLAATIKKEEMLQAAAAAATSSSPSTPVAPAPVTVKLESGTITVSQLQPSQPNVVVVPVTTTATKTSRESAPHPQQSQPTMIQSNNSSVQVQLVQSGAPATGETATVTIIKREQQLSNRQTPTPPSTTMKATIEELRRVTPSPGSAVEQQQASSRVPTPTPTPPPPAQPEMKKSADQPATIGGAGLKVATPPTMSSAPPSVTPMGPPPVAATAASFSVSPAPSQTPPAMKSPSPFETTTGAGTVAPITIKEEPKEEPAVAEVSTKTAAELAIELKKKKRREYQKNRRQQQIQSNKESHHHHHHHHHQHGGGSGGQAKKKPRKSVKIEEDYDTCIDNLMGQLRQLPPMQILEPQLPRNYGVCPLFGTSDLSKFTLLKGYSIASGDLAGGYGNAQLPSVADFYNTRPFGVKEPPPKPAPTSTQRGFYDQEFPPIKFETEDRGAHTRYDFVRYDRDLDSPDTIISTSSPECIRWDASPIGFPGLRLIKEEDPAMEEPDQEAGVYGRMSPIVPILTPVPIRARKGNALVTLGSDALRSAGGAADSNKENEGGSGQQGKDGGGGSLGIKSRFGPPNRLRDGNNVTVTLTLTSSAAEDILGVLRDLANILEIAPPTAFQIVERSATPTSQILGLYQTEGGGKECAPIDIQTILNGTARFCRHCGVVILRNMMVAKAAKFPLLTAGQELESDELYFCTIRCYLGFTTSCRTNIPDDERADDETTTTTVTADRSVDDSNGGGAVVVTPTTVEIKREVLDDGDPMEITVTGGNADEIAPTAGDRKKKHADDSGTDKDQPPAKQLKGVRYKTFGPHCFPVQRLKKPSEKEITETLFRMNITVTPSPKMPDDTRRCIFCHTVGDGVADGPSRLLNFDVDKWVHLNCALWSDGVYETVNGALMNLESALQQSLTSACGLCNNLGATIKCFKTRCTNVYHLSCAMKDGCVFYKNKSTMCATHALRTEKDSELTTLSVQRRVYVDRDESRQVASVMHHSESNNLLRVGSLIFLNVGQLLPHQLQSFHTPNYIYPIGYKIIRFYWSMRKPNKRCRYICSIADVSGRPEFRVLVQEATEEDIELRDATPKAVWQRILEPMALLRKNCQIVQLFPRYVSGEDLFGLTEPAVVRILESLPGIETLTDYRFKYGRNPLLELPLAINPSGAARTEPKLKHTLSWKKPHTQRTGSASQRPTFVPTSSPAGEVACPYSKQFVHSKSSQYKKMKQEWRNNVFLARSKIQGLGLYAARDLEKHTMVIEYIGEVIRTEVSELREKQYEAKNRGIYMFRLDEERVVDATLSGGLARYINHSCNPNCVTETVEVDRELRIIIFAKRRINRGEELSYDYKFDIEDDAHKISCMCGAPNCKKWMN